MLALCVAAAPTDAGRITRTNDAGFEITRIVSEYVGGASETIAPWETQPALPVEGETILYGTSNLFPEFGRVFVWTGSDWRELPSEMYSFSADVMQTGPEGSDPPFASASYVTFRLPPDTVSRIGNRFILFQIYPQPPGPHGDTVEGLLLRLPADGS